MSENITPSGGKSVDSMTSRDLLDKLLAAAWKRRGFNTVVLEIRELLGYADYMVILSGRSSRHARAVAENILREMKKEGVTPLGKEGLDYGRWIVLDFDSVVLHIFQPELRELYDLEGLWAQVPRMEVDEPQWVQSFEDQDEEFEDETWES